MLRRVSGALTVCQSLVLFLLALPLLASGRARDLGPISLPKEQVRCPDHGAEAAAMEELVAFCEAQNQQLRRAGYPACRRGECYESLQAAHGDQARRPNPLRFSLMHGGIYGDLGMMVTYTIVLGQNDFPEISCSPVDPRKKGYTLEQLELLRLVMDKREGEIAAGCPALTGDDEP